jgi:hypothetical protein
MEDWQPYRADISNGQTGEAFRSIALATVHAAHRLILDMEQYPLANQEYCDIFMSCMNADGALRNFLELAEQNYTSLLSTCREIWKIDTRTDSKVGSNLEEFMRNVGEPFYLFNNSKEWTICRSYLSEFVSVYEHGVSIVQAAYVVSASPKYRCVILDRPISLIAPLSRSSDILVSSDDNLISFIEAPLLQAVRRLNDLGIKTSMCSANKNDLPKGKGFISLYCDDLNVSNLSVLNELSSTGFGRYVVRRDKKLFVLEFPLSAHDTVSSVTEYLRFQIEKFDRQVS